MLKAPLLEVKWPPNEQGIVDMRDVAAYIINSFSSTAPILCILYQVALTIGFTSHVINPTRTIGFTSHVINPTLNIGFTSHVINPTRTIGFTSHVINPTLIIGFTSHVINPTRTIRFTSASVECVFSRRTIIESARKRSMSPYRQCKLTLLYFVNQLCKEVTYSRRNGEKNLGELFCKAHDMFNPILLQALYFAVYFVLIFTFNHDFLFPKFHLPRY